MPSNAHAPIRVDIVSDVVCPWCAIGYLQLTRAAQDAGVDLDIHWHPFELNPQMSMDGEHLFQHLQGKYGITAEQSQKSRTQITELGADLGFTFAFSDDMYMWNTFRAHQLIDWAESLGKGHEAKLALLHAHFTDLRNVSDPDVLGDIATQIGLNAEAAKAMLSAGTHAQAVREKQAFWTSKGVQGVPTMVFGGKYATTGAQGAEGFGRVLEAVQRENAA